MSKMLEIYILEGEHTRCCEMSGCNKPLPQHHILEERYQYGKFISF